MGVAENSIFARNVSTDIVLDKETFFFECRGTMIVQNASFLSSSPWLVPFCISSLKGKSLNELPSTINLCSTRYNLGGFSMLRSGHYTAVVNWRGFIMMDWVKQIRCDYKILRKFILMVKRDHNYAYFFKCTD